jgi:GxxExxY protein
MAGELDSGCAHRTSESECGGRLRYWNRESAKERNSMTNRHEFEPESKEVIGCALEVHQDLGPGFLESVYHNAMAVNLINRRIPFDSERRSTIWFQGVEVGHHCFDLIIRETIVVELKAVDRLAEIHFAQLRSYLRAAGLKVGLLMNFSAPKLVVRRVVNTVPDRSPTDSSTCVPSNDVCQ